MMMNESPTRPRSHTELAHLAIDQHTQNFSDEFSDRALPTISDAIQPDALNDMIFAIHDSRYARMTRRYDDTIPMTDEHADDLASELPDACDDADCCNAAFLIINAIYDAADYAN